MKNNILKIVSIAFVFSLVFVACGGGEENLLSVRKTTITGNATDGPIYGASVVVYDKNGKELGRTTTSSQDGKIGDYSLDIKDLPDEYIVKVLGGTDTGPDGIINDNDEKSFEMSSVGTKSNPTTYITPATSIIANMVEDGNKTIEEAKLSVKKSLGLPNGIDLTTTNPKINNIANNAGTFVAQVLKTIPTNNKIQVLKSITKEFKSKSDTNKSVATISSTDIIINDLNLTAIANDVRVIKPDNIEQTEINKLEKSSDLLVKKIKSTVKKIKPINRQTADEKKEAMASHKALEKLSEQIKQEDINTMDLDTLELFSLKMEDSFNKILEDNISTLTNDNIGILAGVIESNLDKNSSSIHESLKTIALNTKQLDDDSIEIYKKLYATIDINDSKKVSNIKKSDIVNLTTSMNTENNETKELLSSVIASKLSLLVKNSNGDINSSEITEVKSATIDNDILKDKLKNLALNKKSSSKVEQKSAKLALDNINKNFKKENFEFDNNSKNNLEDLEEKTRSKLQALLSDNTKSLTEIFDEIKAIEISSKSVDLDKDFDENSFDKNQNAVQVVITKLREEKNNDNNVDLVTSIDKVEKEFEESSETNSTIDDVATNITNNINEYINIRKKAKIYVKPFSFPKIGDISMPSLLDNNNKKISLN